MVVSGFLLNRDGCFGCVVVKVVCVEDGFDV